MNSNSLQATATKALEEYSPCGYTAPVSDPTEHVTVGANIRAVREATGKSQTDFAAELGMKPSTYNRMEQSRGFPSSKTLLKIAVLAGCSVERLIENVWPAYVAVTNTTGREKSGNGKIGVPTHEGTRGADKDGISRESRKVAELRASLQRRINDAERSFEDLHGALTAIGVIARQPGVLGDHPLAVPEPPRRAPKPGKNRR